MSRRNLYIAPLIVCCSITLTTHANDQLAALGKMIFFDTSLSKPTGQSCASCHAPIAGWTGPDTVINAAGAVYEGATHGRFGNRKPPMAAYATFSPPLHLDPEEDNFVGGTFWDGRATGWLMGSPTAEQAQGPFLNPVEQNLSDAAEVVGKVCGGGYGDRFRDHFGLGVCDNPVNGYNAMAQAIAAFESSREVNPFNSKYDHHLKDPQRYPLSEQERLGLELFDRQDKGNCAACHPSQPGPDGEPPLFTDFTYDNLGVPPNLDNPWYRMSEFNDQGATWVDEGIGGFLKTVPRFAHRSADNLGKQKVPSLRNVDMRPSAGFVKSFMHNGSLKTLKDVVHFYNTRDTKPVCREADSLEPGKGCWPTPEIAANMNTEELGSLGLSDAEEDAIVAFMKTLTDGWVAPQD